MAGPTAPRSIAASIVGTTSVAVTRCGARPDPAPRRDRRRAAARGAAVPDRRQHRDRAGGMKQRRHHQPARVGTERPDRLEVHGVGDQVAVREHHALGGAGRAARVEQPGHRVVLEPFERLSRGRRRPGTPRSRPRGRSRAPRVSLRVRRSRGPANSTLAPGVLERVAQLGLGVALVERHQDHARGRAPPGTPRGSGGSCGPTIATRSPVPRPRARSPPISRRHRSQVSA